MLPGLFVSARANAHTHAHTWIYSTRLKRIDYTVFDTRFFFKAGSDATWDLSSLR